MSAKVNVSNVEVLNNPATFHDAFQFQITFECLEPLPHDLEWKLTYVGSAESEDYDQVLDTVLVGPVPEGRHKFVFEADCPDPARVPNSELVGVTVVLLSCAYDGRDFIKIGYFVRHEYTDQELRDNPPEKPDVDKAGTSGLEAAPSNQENTPPTDTAEKLNGSSQASATS